MNANEVMHAIESPEFAARVNVASDFQTFLREASEQEAVSSLRRELASDDIRRRLCDRICQLARQQIDLRYENPNDTALTLYLWLLSLKEPQRAKRAAAVVVAHARQCWWATKVAYRLLHDTDGS